MDEGPILTDTTSRQNLTRPALVLFIVVLMVAAMLFIPWPWPTRHETNWMDAVTGSMKRQSSTFFGRSPGAIVEPSPLELRLRQAGIAWTPDWRFLHDYEYTLAGRSGAISCGRAPEIYQYTVILDRYVELSTDDELRAFVQIMQSGTEDEQRTFLEAAADKALGNGK